MAKFKPQPQPPREEEIPEDQGVSNVSDEPVEESAAPIEPPASPNLESLLPETPKAFAGDKVMVSKAGLNRLYRSLLQNKAGAYTGLGAKRIIRELLEVPDAEIQAHHEYLRHNW